MHSTGQNIKSFVWKLWSTHKIRLTLALVIKMLIFLVSAKRHEQDGRIRSSLKKGLEWSLKFAGTIVLMTFFAS